MKTRFRLYLETSFWRRLGDSADWKRRRTTYRFLRAVESRHDLFISRWVTDEISQIPDMLERRQIRRKIDDSGSRTLTENRQIERAAFELLALTGNNNRLLADMWHLGYTVVSGLDALVTWDMRDLARDRTRTAAQVYGRRHGMEVPLIGTPEEVAQWLNLKIG